MEICCPTNAIEGCAMFVYVPLGFFQNIIKHMQINPYAQFCGEAKISYMHLYLKPPGKIIVSSHTQRLCNKISHRFNEPKPPSLSYRYAKCVLFIVMSSTLRQIDYSPVLPNYYYLCIKHFELAFIFIFSVFVLI